MEEDSEIILKEIESNEKLPVSHITRKGRTDEFSEEYFSELDVDILEKLYNKFEIDFLLFNYTIDDYLSYIR